MHSHYNDLQVRMSSGRYGLALVLVLLLLCVLCFSLHSGR